MNAPCEPKRLSFYWDILNTSLNQWKEPVLRKVLITLAAVLALSTISFASSSYAHDHESESENLAVDSSEGSHDEIEQMHVEIEEFFEDHSGVVIPPVVVRLGRPADPNIFILPVLPMETENTSGTSSLPKPDFEQIGLKPDDRRVNFDPYKLEPLEVESLVLTQATPADEFMDGAKTFALGLGAAALALLGVTGVNAYRSRKKKASKI